MVSQFNIYTSSDVGAPTLNGTSGSLISVLNWCLISGSSNPAGWTADYTSSVVGSGSLYRPPSGSRMYLSVRDDGAVTSREARIQGFENVVNYLTGSGQFPAFTQGITPFGYLTFRKSVQAGVTARNWICFADAYTMYFFGLSGDTVNDYFGLWFGDIYSLKGSSDQYRCHIMARATENGAGVDQADTTGLINAPLAGHFMPRTAGGGGYSITTTKVSDLGKQGSQVLLGVVQYPNGPDNGIYMAPVRVFENTISTMRGRLRGMWCVLHPISNFVDGDTINGTGDLAGKTFRIVKQGYNNGMWAIETSATVETN